MISVFDGDSCALFDGRIGVDRFPTRTEGGAAVLADVKDASAARAVAQDGPSLTAAVRDGTGRAQVGGRMVPIPEQKDGTSRCRFPHVV